ncbi:MAG: NifB/NifX family molybdenum-iron cluster-binding protein [Desulfovibrio sp.]|nr:NifB/NifX family molybdenum-iron cluster-binding protein [Desulfovibrio sp.]
MSKHHIIVAVPSEAPGGLAAAPSPHFGHCFAYTVARIEDGRIVDASVRENKGHEHGGCVQPVRELADEGVTALISGGMGMRPLQAMNEAGIQVYYNPGYATVKEALDAFAANQLQPFGPDQLCKGNCGHHGEQA